MALYQLVGTVLTPVLSLCAFGFQTTISKLVAERNSPEAHSSGMPFLLGLSIALPLSLFCSYCIYQNAAFLSIHFLHQSQTENLLRILSFSIPLSTIHSCVNGYFYGKKNVPVPAFTQLLEQAARVGSVWLLNRSTLQLGEVPSIENAIIGLTVGEIFSVTASLLAFRHQISRKFFSTFECRLGTIRREYAAVFAMVLPLTANRLILNVLHSVEAVSIPTMLEQYGYTSASALSIYGVLTGMAMPFILFPNVITSSASLILLPTLSEKQAAGNQKAIKKDVRQTLQYSLLLGIGCMFLFVIFGRFIGNFVFQSSLAGYFITVLGFLCPFLYSDATLSAILQSLGKVNHLFILNLLCVLLRLFGTLLLIPLFGIKGYLWGLLLSQFLKCLLLVLFGYGFTSQD